LSPQIVGRGVRESARPRVPARQSAPWPGLRRARWCGAAGPATRPARSLADALHRVQCVTQVLEIFAAKRRVLRRQRNL